MNILLGKVPLKEEKYVLTWSFVNTFVPLVPTIFNSCTRPPNAILDNTKSVTCPILSPFELVKLVSCAAVNFFVQVLVSISYTSGTAFK